jgi:chloramphenicol 3-O phosphotransferase
VEAQAGRIILLNGASSSGKSTLARELQNALPEPFWHYSIDHLRDANVLPMVRIKSGEFPWIAQRPAFFDGFHRSVAAFAAAGNHQIVEHIVETQAWMARLVALLGSFDVFFVGIHCPLEELERRETARGDRRVGEARADLRIIHSFGAYDLELDGTQPVAANVSRLMTAWHERGRPNAFDKMGAAQH